MPTIAIIPSLSQHYTKNITRVHHRSNNIFELMTNEPIDALLKTGGTPGGEAEEDDDDQNLMEEEVDKSLHIKMLMMLIMMMP